MFASSLSTQIKDGRDKRVLVGIDLLRGVLFGVYSVRVYKTSACVNFTYVVQFC